MSSIYPTMDVKMNLVFGIFQSHKLVQEFLHKWRGVFNKEPNYHNRVVFWLCFVRTNQSLRSWHCKSLRPKGGVYLFLFKVDHIIPAIDATLFNVPRLGNVIADGVKKKLSGAVSVDD